MLEMTITISGKTMSDIELAIEEVCRLVVRQGCTSGTNANDSGEFYFSTSGDEEDSEEEEEEEESDEEEEDS